MVSTLPRDESNRINKVDYASVVKNSKAEEPRLIELELWDDWWCNKAVWQHDSVDGVSKFEAGFVGSDVKYIGYIQAFNINPTWLALQLNQTTVTGEYKYRGETWQIYQSIVKHDPAKSKDYIMVLKYNETDAVILYGVADKSELENFAGQVVDRIRGATVID